MARRGTVGDADGAPLDERVRALLAANDVSRATTETLRALGPEVLGFLYGVLGSEADAEEVLAATSERLWRSLTSFEWGCSLRTWAYVIARHEIERFRRGARRHVAGRVPISELEDVLTAVRTETRSDLRSEKRVKLRAFRDELSVDDRTLLILRVDRGLPWDEIALAFLENPERCPPEERKRESARLRKRYQIIKQHLAKRAREEGLLPK
jgi:RNA polymerase sigma-70 factor (ECF subfamily)